MVKKMNTEHLTNIDKDIEICKITMIKNTTIREMLTGKRIFVPNNQRVYSWETELNEAKLPKQINLFLCELENQIRSSTRSSYDFGHFIFVSNGEKKNKILDGQQRLITIIIFVEEIFRRLKKIRSLKKEEEEIFEAFINDKTRLSFETIDCKYFKNIIINQVKRKKNSRKYISTLRLLDANCFFYSQLKSKNEAYLLKMLDTIINASCTTSILTRTKKSGNNT